MCKALRAESSGIKTTGGKPKEILIWNSSIKWINIDMNSSMSPQIPRYTGVCDFCLEMLQRISTSRLGATTRGSGHDVTAPLRCLRPVPRCGRRVSACRHPPPGRSITAPLAVQRGLRRLHPCAMRGPSAARQETDARRPGAAPAAPRALRKSSGAVVSMVSPSLFHQAPPNPPTLAARPRARVSRARSRVRRAPDQRMRGG